MSENIDIQRLFDDVEPVAAISGGHVGSVGEAALLSIAVSLKRIADAWGKGPPVEPTLCEHGNDWMDCDQCVPF